MKKGDLFKSDFLFPDTDFITGMGSVLNIAGNYFEFATSRNELIADLKALRCDWGIVGQDISKAAKCVRDNEAIESLTEETCN